MSLYPAIGAAIRRARLARGWNQAALGARMGVSHAAVSDIERGKTRPNLDELAIIATLLGVDLDALIAPALADGPRRRIARWAREFDGGPQKAAAR